MKIKLSVSLLALRKMSKIKKLDLNLFIDEKKFLKFKKRTSGLYENKEIILSHNEQNEYNLYTEKYIFYEKKILEEFDSKHI